MSLFSGLQGGLFGRVNFLRQAQQDGAFRAGESYQDAFQSLFRRRQQGSDPFQGFTGTVQRNQSLLGDPRAAGADAVRQNDPVTSLQQLFPSISAETAPPLAQV